jgi:hypothetical protein
MPESSRAIEAAVMAAPMMPPSASRTRMLTSMMDLGNLEMRRIPY